MEDVSILQEYNVRVYRKNEDIIDIINNILEGNLSEEAFYVVDIGKIIKQVQKWDEAFPTVKPYYAVKCNPNPMILKILASLDVNFDCASKNEIASVMSVTGDDPKRIIFANPCKMSNQIKYARANDVDLMTFDSDHELYKIKLYHPYSDLILRIKVDDSESLCKFGCKFGVELPDVERLLGIAKALSLKVVGISFHVGSGCKNPEQFRRAIEDSKKCFDVAESLGMHFTILDIGGGFEDETFRETARIVNDAIRESGFDSDVNFIAEPGRFFVSSSHTLVVNVIGKKDSVDPTTSEKTFVYYLNDGMYGSFNCMHFDHAKPIVCPFNERDGKTYRSKIFGPTCDSMDKIAEEVLLPELAIGEWCYVENFGAYTCAAASTFNGFTQTNTINIMTP